MGISENIKRVKDVISAVSCDSGIIFEDIKIVAASKYATAEQIEEAFAAGIVSFGENKVQDLLSKQEILKEIPIEWHFIGHLQANKVKKIIGRVALIHSVDSLKIAKEISRRADERGKKQDILMQSNVSFEESKGGFEPGKSLQMASEIAKLEAIELKGLMTIAPFTREENVLLEHFRKSRELFDSIEAEVGPAFNILSMGMSNDFELALEYRANLLRLGSVIWEENR